METIITIPAKTYTVKVKEIAIITDNPLDIQARILIGRKDPEDTIGKWNIYSSRVPVSELITQAIASGQITQADADGFYKILRGISARGLNITIQELGNPFTGSDPWRRR